MSDELALRMAGRQRHLRVTAVGGLHADNAHRLPKVVLGLLRQYAPEVVLLDLGAVNRIDAVGVAAVVLCQKTTARHGATFTLDGSSPAVRSALRAHYAGHLLPELPRHHAMPLRRRHTGTVCPGRSRPQWSTGHGMGGRR
jgi:anti-anti-sigma factor